MTDTFERLIDSARAARDAAYAPYSMFRVGAALEATDGAVFVGCNVESASYGLTLCAERSALAAAVAAGRRSFARLALSTEQGPPAPPCGACRQLLSEFGQDLHIRSQSATGAREWQLGELLPEPFALDEARREAGEIA